MKGSGKKGATKSFLGSTFAVHFPAPIRILGIFVTNPLFDQIGPIDKSTLAMPVLSDVQPPVRTTLIDFTVTVQQFAQQR